MRCTDLLAGRLFPGATRDVYDRSSLKPGVMYYEQEGKGNGNHPIADFFFRSAADQLVLINVTGGGPLKAEERRVKLVEWIEEHGKDITGCSGGLYGVVIAPQNTSAESKYDVDKNVVVVSGRHARALLLED